VYRNSKEEKNCFILKSSITKGEVLNGAVIHSDQNRAQPTKKKFYNQSFTNENQKKKKKSG
jgi:hypothetical protein